MSYDFLSRTKEFPHVKNATAQSWAFNSTATVLNTGKFELKAWKIFIGFQHDEIIVNAGGAVLMDGDDFPAAVGNGSYFSGSPQADLKTSIDTAGDPTQIQVKIQLSGTQFGVKPPGIPMPKTIRLVNDGYKCPAPIRRSKYLIALVSFMPLISPTNLNLLYIFLQRPRCMYVALGTQNLRSKF